MSRTNEFMPAFPCQAYGMDGHPCGKAYSGMSVRELYIGMAMQGLLSNPAFLYTHDESGIKWIKDHAIMQVDAMFAEEE